MQPAPANGVKRRRARAVHKRFLALLSLPTAIIRQLAAALSILKQQHHDRDRGRDEGHGGAKNTYIKRNDLDPRQPEQHLP